MINPKYDPDNYIKHLAIPVITDNQKIKQLFRASSLRIRWFYQPINKQQTNSNGVLRIHVNTPFGRLHPQDYRLQMNTAKDNYIQFFSISPAPDFEYEIEVISPDEINRSMIEIWEYIGEKTSQNYSTFSPAGNNIMSISFPPTPFPNSNSGTSTNIAYSATSITMLAANLLRTNGGLIVNNATKNLWVNFGATAATTASPSIMIPANGGSIDIPSGYVGAITGIWVAAGSGSATVVEFI